MSIHLGYGYGMPKVVKRLLIANIAVFVLTSLIPRHVFNVYGIFGLVPQFVNSYFMIWQFVTYMFLHGGIGHIFMNMLILWMFGSELEYNWGSKDFLIYYLVCGIGGGLLVWFTALPFIGLSSSFSPTIGASGAIFGLLVAFGLMWPDRMIYVWFLFPVKALHMVIIFGAIDLFYGLTGTGGNVAVFAHVGGGLVGYLYLKFGWRLSVQFEALANRWRRRRFTVVDGGKKRGGSGNNSRNQKSNDSEHPDLDEEVDRILDKIARSGMDSLTDRERRILDRASNRRR